MATLSLNIDGTKMNGSPVNGSEIPYTNGHHSNNNLNNYNTDMEEEMEEDIFRKSENDITKEKILGLTSYSTRSNSMKYHSLFYKLKIKLNHVGF
jgi:hypothetical protein